MSYRFFEAPALREVISLMPGIIKCQLRALIVSKPKFIDRRPASEMHPPRSDNVMQTTA